VWMAAMAEGAIEGTRMDYRVSSPRSADFRFSRFGAKPGTTRPRDLPTIPAFSALAGSGACAGWCRVSLVCRVWFFSLRRRKARAVVHRVVP